MNLPQHLGDQIDLLASEGNDLLDEDNFDAAIEKWTRALALLPEPKADWGAFMWLSASLGEAHYQQSHYEQARGHFLDALNAPGGIDNPFVHYRLGQCHWMLGQEALAMEELLKAYMLEGEAIFTMEEGGMAFLQILRDRRLID